MFKRIMYPMEKMLDVEAQIDFAKMLAVISAGLNIIWGMFVLPLGFIGFALAAVSVFMFLGLDKVHHYYKDKRYETSRDLARFYMYLGLISGFIITGFAIYRIYAHLDDIVMKKYLVQPPPPAPRFAPPQFPQRKG